MKSIISSAYRSENVLSTVVCKFATSSVQNYTESLDAE